MNASDTDCKFVTHGLLMIHFANDLKSGIILLKSRIAIRVIVDNLRRENQLYLWLFVKMF